MQLSQLRDELKRKLKNPTYSNAKLLTLMNEAVDFISEEVDLPELVYRSTVHTSPTYAYVDLPSNFHKKILYAEDEDGNPVAVSKNWRNFVDTWGDLTYEGAAVNEVVAHPDEEHLYYQPIAQEDITTSAGISFDAATDTISDTGLGLNLTAADVISVSGSTSNDTDYTVSSVATDDSSCVVTGSLVDEAAGESVTITKGTAIIIEHYRRPTAMSSDTDEPDGVPAKFHKDLVVNYVLKEELTAKEGREKDAAVSESRFETALSRLRTYISLVATRATRKHFEG